MAVFFYVFNIRLMQQTKKQYSYDNAISFSKKKKKNDDEKTKNDENSGSFC